MNIGSKLGNILFNDVTGYVKRNVGAKLKESLGICIIFDIGIPGRQDISKYILEWIDNHTPKKSNIVHLKTELNESLDFEIVVKNDADTLKIIMLEPGTFMEYSPYKYEGSSSKYKDNIVEVCNEGGLVKAKLTIYGLNYGKYYADLRKYIHYKQKETNELYRGKSLIKVIKSSNPSKPLTFNGRTENTIQGSHVKPLVDSIGNWIDSEDLYNSLEIPYKLGILLLGPPGTGKTSAVKMLASKFGRTIITIDADTLKKPKELDDLFLKRRGTSCYIILLEDIDRVIIEHKKSKDGVDIIGTLLNLLDGIGSPNGSIIIATANEVQELPEAILRPGRFDIVTQVAGLTENEAIKMINRFDIKSEEVTLDFIKNHPIDCYDKNTGLYNPSKLQNILMPLKTQESIKGIK